MRKSMNVSPELLQFAGSLVAILALAGIARALKLGGEPKLLQDDDVRRAAGEAVEGFRPVAISRDREGRGAILRDAAGRVLVLKPHGNFFAGRLLAATARARLDSPTALEIDSGERRYGKVSLDIDDATAWAEVVNALGSTQHA